MMLSHTLADPGSAPKDPGFAVKFLINRFIKEGVSNSDSDDVWAIRVGIEHAWTSSISITSW
jgi:hypothetical protein